jgi:DNA polymerase III epsilon subunit-like protein
MRILVFDTETTGLPKSKLISEYTINLWPHIIQFSYIIFDTELNDIIEITDNIVKLSEGTFISEDSIKTHGITDKITNKYGIDLEIIFNNFFNNLRNVDLMIGHNVAFDINMIRAELFRLINSKLSEERKIKHRNNLDFLVNYKNTYCTLQNSIELCKIEALDSYGTTYFKYPKLAELHNKLFETVPNNLHDSLNDILITLRCYMKMKHNIDLNNTCNKFIELLKQKNIL